VQDEADLSLRHLKPSRAMLFNEVMKAKSDIPPRDEEPRARGPNLANYFNDLMKGHASMNRTEELRDIAKAAGGMAAIAKSIIAKGATNFTEHEFAGALMEHAKLNKRDNESAAQSFSRILQSDPDIRRAYGITRGYMSIEPTWVEIGGTISEDDSKAAFDQLTEMANAQRAKAPWLSGDQAFSRVFSAPEMPNWPTARIAGQLQDDVSYSRARPCGWGRPTREGRTGFFLSPVRPPTRDTVRRVSRAAPSRRWCGVHDTEQQRQPGHGIPSPSLGAARGRALEPRETRIIEQDGGTASALKLLPLSAVQRKWSVFLLSLPGRE